VITVAPAPAPEAVEEVTTTAPDGRRPMPTALAITLASLTAFSVVVLFFGAFAYGLSGLQEQRSQHQLYAAFRGLLDPASPTAPSIVGSIPSGTPIALLNSPAAGLRNVVVVEGTSPSNLLAGPGHLPNSPLPGQVGQSILMARSTTAGAPFGDITRLRKGDVITVTTGYGTFRFSVEGQLVAGQPLPEISKSGALLTLVTSAGSGWLGRWAGNHLVYVDALLQGRAVASPPGRPTAVSPVEYQGRSDPTAWPFIIFWLQALLVASLAIAWLWTRWGHAQTWLVGAPLIFAILWGLSTEAMRLLPNVY